MITIIDYGIGNLQSVQKAFDKIGVHAVISSNPKDLMTAERIVLPGVGSFAEGMDNLKHNGLLPVLNRKVYEEGTPFLGICLGFQMLTKGSEEGGADGLGWVDADTKYFHFNGTGSQYRIPHIGWNDLSIKRENHLLNGLPTESCFYFAHSYYVTCHDESAILATTQYGCEFVTVIQKDHIFGTQFHPEKSQANGLAVLRNFVEYHPGA